MPVEVPFSEAPGRFDLAEVNFGSIARLFPQGKDLDTWRVHHQLTLPSTAASGATLTALALFSRARTFGGRYGGFRRHTDEIPAQSWSCPYASVRDSNWLKPRLPSRHGLPSSRLLFRGVFASVFGRYALARAGGCCSRSTTRLRTSR
jgi:hypothetical protein